MGVMTEAAALGLDRVTSMSFFECVIDLVTIKAECRVSFGQEILLVRTVSHVAGSAAILGQDFVHHLFLEVLLFMARITRLVPCRGQQVRPLGRMGVMTGRALSLDKRRMHELLVEFDLFLAMTPKAELVPLLFQEEFRDDAVPQMAIFAFLLFDRRMGILHPHVLVFELLVAVKALLAGKFLCRVG